MAHYQITIDTTHDLGPCDVQAGKRPFQNLEGFAKFLNRVAGGNVGATTVDIQGDAQTTSGVRASGTFTVAAGNLSVADTFTVQGTALTAIANGSTPTSVQFALGAATQGVTAAKNTAINIAAAVNANTTINKYVSAAATGTTTGIVTITSLDYGALSNAITLAKSAANGTVSAATLAGGTRVANAISF